MGISINWGFLLQGYKLLSPRRAFVGNGCSLHKKCNNRDDSL